MVKFCAQTALAPLPIRRRMGGSGLFDEDITLLRMPGFELRTVHDYSVVKYITESFVFFHFSPILNADAVFQMFSVNILCNFFTTFLNGVSFPDGPVLRTDLQLTANMCFY